MIAWTVKINSAAAVTFKAAKIESCSLDFVSRGTDTATIQAAPSSSWTYGDTVAVYADGTRVFLGRVTRNALSRSGIQSSRAVTVQGPQHWLGRIVFRQLWSILAGDELGSVPSSRVILNQTAGNLALTIDGQLHEIVDYAAARGAPIAFGSSAVGFTLPYDECRDLTCQQAVERVLRFAPFICSWIDYSAEVPAIHFGGSAEYAYDRIEADTVNYRHDLVVPGVTIEVERVGDMDGKQYRTIEVYAAGDTDELDSLFATLPVAGASSSKTMRYIDVAVEAVGDINSEAWWIAKHPRLSGVEVADLTVIEASRGDDPSEYPNISAVPLIDLEPVGCKARVETFKATVDIKQRNADGDIVAVEHAVRLEMDFVTTDAETRVYEFVDSASGVTAEPVPMSLAYDIAAHLSVLYAEGSFSAPLSDGLPHPGQYLSGLPSGEAPIQQVSVSCAADACFVAFGPPAQLSIQDMADRLSGFRSRRISTRYESRATAEPPAESVDDKLLIAPLRTAFSKPGEYRRLDVNNPNGESTRSVSLDPEDLGDDETASLRSLTFTPSGGSETTVKALLTADVTIPPGGSAAFPPSGWETRAVKLYCGSEILEATILVQTEGLSSTEYDSADARKLLQVAAAGEATVLAIDYGRAVD